MLTSALSETFPLFLFLTFDSDSASLASSSSPVSGLSFDTWLEGLDLVLGTSGLVFLDFFPGTAAIAEVPSYLGGSLPSERVPGKGISGLFFFAELIVSLKIINYYDLTRLE